MKALVGFLFAAAAVVGAFYWLRNGGDPLFVAMVTFLFGRVSHSIEREL